MNPQDKTPTAAKSKTPVEEKSPAEIRAEIDETREEMGETVADLAAKTDVKAQAQAKVEDVKERAKAALPESSAEAQELAKQNQKPLAIAGAVVGLFLLWRLLKS